VFGVQLYDFTAPQDCPTVIAYHPTQQVFACGFESGVLRVFNVATTTMLVEHKYIYILLHLVVNHALLVNTKALKYVNCEG